MQLKRYTKPLTACLSLLFAAIVAAGDYGEFSGEKKVACEAFMCLSTNQGRPSECKDSLKKYYEIKVKKSFGIDPKKTREARKDFLKLCPSEQSDSQILAVIDGDTCNNAECSDDTPPIPDPDECVGKEFSCQIK